MKIKNIIIALNEKYNFKINNNIYDDLDDYHNNDDVDNNDVGVVHNIGLMMMMFMMITMMHKLHCRIYHYHNSYHL